MSDVKVKVIPTSEVVFTKVCDFKGVDRKVGEKVSVTEGQAKILKAKELIN